MARRWHVAANNRPNGHQEHRRSTNIVLRSMKAHGGLFVIIFTCVELSKIHSKKTQIVRAGFAVVIHSLQAGDISSLARSLGEDGSFLGEAGSDRPGRAPTHGRRDVCGVGQVFGTAWPPGPAGGRAAEGCPHDILKPKRTLSPKRGAKPSGEAPGIQKKKNERRT